VEKGGLTAALTAAGLTVGQAVAWADELRLGLHGQVRRRWVPRGVKLRLKVQVRYVWRYLALAVDPAGRLRWRWLERFRKEPVAETIAAWQADGVRALVWDSAPSHTAKLVRAVGLPPVALPPYSPELNPAERVFEELRRAVEGLVYADIEAKVAAVEAALARLAADPARVRRLVGWSWITQALDGLPTHS
jgi:DDE superfamily endonuclease